MMSVKHHWDIPVLSDAQFKKMAAFIYDACGIHLSIVKKTMLTSRLIGRLRALSMDSFEDYYDHVTDDRGRGEVTHLIDAVATNKTDFFREESHFSFLVSTLLPRLKSERVITQNCLQIWSAGCASGEEPYTMAMVLAEYAKKCPGFDFKIFGSDISTRILKQANAGIYQDRKITQIPQDMVQRYMLKGRGENQGRHRIVPELQGKVTFKQVNFTDRVFPFKTLFDVIFCRNVIIYFDKKTQIHLFKKFYEHLKPGGFFLIGHSEMMPAVGAQFEKVEPTVYRKI